MAAPHPGIGDWYRAERRALFEVVALDDDDGTIEIQYFDGTVEEMDVEDWEAQWDDGALEAAEAPEDWSGSVDVGDGDGNGRNADVTARIATCAPARWTASTCSSSRALISARRCLRSAATRAATSDARRRA